MFLLLTQDQARKLEQQSNRIRSAEQTNNGLHSLTATDLCHVHLLVASYNIKFSVLPRAQCTAGGGGYLKLSIQLIFKYEAPMRDE